MQDFDSDKLLDVLAHHSAEVPTYDPDAWADDMDERLGWKEPEPPQINAQSETKPQPVALAEQLEQFAEWLSPNRLRKEALPGMGMRVLALLWMVNRGACREMTQTELAEKVGVSRAAISWNVRQLARSLGIRVRRMRSESTAEANRKAALRSWRKGNRKPRAKADSKSQDQAQRAMHV